MMVVSGSHLLSHEGDVGEPKDDDGGGDEADQLRPNQQQDLAEAEAGDDCSVELGEHDEPETAHFGVEEGGSGLLVEDDANASHTPHQGNVQRSPSD